MENIKNVPNHRPDTYVHVYLIEFMYYLIGEITYIYAPMHTVHWTVSNYLMWKVLLYYTQPYQIILYLTIFNYVIKWKPYKYQFLLIHPDIIR